MESNIKQEIANTYSIGTTGGHMLIHAQQTNYFIITVSLSSSLSESKLIGKMVHFYFSTSITLSTCILTTNNSQLQSTSYFSVFFTFAKGGALTFSQYHLSPIIVSKPLIS